MKIIANLSDIPLIILTFILLIAMVIALGCIVQISLQEIIADDEYKTCMSTTDKIDTVIIYEIQEEIQP